MIVEALAEFRMGRDLGVAHIQVGMEGIVPQSIFARAGLNLCGPLAAKTLIGKKCPGDSLTGHAPQNRGEGHAVLDGLVRTLSEMGEHRMRSVAKQRQPTA